MHNLVLRQRDAPLGAPLVQEGVMHKCSASVMHLRVLRTFRTSGGREAQVLRQEG